MPESRKRKKNQSTNPDRPKPVAPEQLQSPSWWAPTMVTLMVLGLVWVVITYLFQGGWPIPGIGNWNLGIGAGIAMAGFLMTMRWK